MKIFYWAPWIGKVGSVKSVMNSAYILEKYSKNHIKTKIIDAVGEWREFKDHIRYINLSNFKFFKFLPKTGFLKSRISYILIFLYSFFPLLNLLKKEKPDYLIVHLITSLPLLLKIIFNFDTKIILRISGYPKMNFLRKFIWKRASKKIYKVTFPTSDLLNQFREFSIFGQEQMTILRDPIISFKNLPKLKNEKSLSEMTNIKNYFISVGRFTKQKNFEFLVKNFIELKKQYVDIKLVILGDGELMNRIKKIIINEKLEQDILTPGYQKNVFNYFSKARALILPSLWEDPGFVIIEAAACNLNIISSDCKNGPKEILLNGKAGYLFKNNDSDNFKQVFKLFMKSDKNDLFQKKIIAKKQAKKFTYFSHYKSFKNII
ncbi:glycosyltransferase [Candidatus Pelagibacter sp.]|nr:glycosyltransferase [Candidatus Pelagibacter sp.]